MQAKYTLGLKKMTMTMTLVMIMTMVLTLTNTICKILILLTIIMGMNVLDQCRLCFGKCCLCKLSYRVGGGWVVGFG